MYLCTVNNVTMNIRTYFDENNNPLWDYIENLPEFRIMKGCHHSTYWHNEGDPWDHTVLVVKNMVDSLKIESTFKSYDIDEWHAEALLMAALYHDIAKPVVTKWDDKKQDWTAPKHSEEGAKMARLILYDWDDVEQREYIVGLIRNHMVLHHILEGDDDQKRYKKFFRFCGCDKVNISYKHQCLLCRRDDYASWCKDISIVRKIDTQRKIFDLENKKFDGHCPPSVLPMHLVYSAKKEMYGIDNIINLTSKPCINVYVLIGLPGSGKSTWANRNAPELPVVSRDIARIELGMCEDGEKYLGTKDEENRVTSYCEKKIVNLAKSGKDFIIDNTHLRQAYRDRIHELLKDYTVNYIYVYVEAPTLDENIRRREDDGFGDKSRTIIERMLMSFEFPYGYEYDKLIIEKQ